MKPRLRGLVALAILAVALAVGGCANERVGVIDTERVFTESPKIKQMEEQWQTDAKAKVDQFNQERANLSDEELSKRNLEVSGEIQQSQKEFIEQVDGVIKQTIAEIAKEKNLSAVVAKEMPTQSGKRELVVQGGIDITDEVVNKLQ